MKFWKGDCVGCEKIRAMNTDGRPRMHMVKIADRPHPIVCPGRYEHVSAIVFMGDAEARPYFLDAQGNDISAEVSILLDDGQHARVNQQVRRSIANEIRRMVPDRGRITKEGPLLVANTWHDVANFIERVGDWEGWKL